MFLLALNKKLFFIRRGIMRFHKTGRLKLLVESLQGGDTFWGLFCSNIQIRETK
jgi:hypothetical protein